MTRNVSIFVIDGSITKSNEPHLERTVSVIAAVAEVGYASVPDIVAATDLPRSTAHRLSHQLADLGLLEYDRDARAFRIGNEIFRLAYQGLPDDWIESGIRQELQSLADETQETAILARLLGFNVSLLFAEMPTERARATVMPALGTVPRLVCSSSRAILAFQPDDHVERLLAEPTRSFTEHTVSSKIGLKAKLAEVRAKGYAVCTEEIDLGITSLCVPVHLPRSGVLFSIGLVGPSGRMEGRAEEILAPQLADQARRIAGVMGRCVAEGSPPSFERSATVMQRPRKETSREHTSTGNEKAQ